MFYLDFLKVNCKNCYKCLRSCPVKAIDMRNNQAKIIESRCILCGNCTRVCPQNAKIVHDDTTAIVQLLAKPKPVIASVAPSFVSSFGSDGFEPFRAALKKLGFHDAFETSEGAAAVTAEYKKLLSSGKYENFITSACPAVNRAIQLYHHDVLEYLAPVDSPMVAHAKILKSRFKDAAIVFIGPCIAKKREAKENGLAGALTFEELKAMFDKRGIVIDGEKDKSTSRIVERMPETTAEKAENQSDEKTGDGGVALSAKYYPISRGIIKSFDSFPAGYEYIAIDGVDRLDEALEDLKNVKGVFLEINACDGACVNGPCILPRAGGAVEANALIRRYTSHAPKDVVRECPSLAAVRKPMEPGARVPTEGEIKAVLESIGKFKPADELNCGACGYGTCREKAWAVVNGYAEQNMCVPYMREKAESMGNVIIENSPNGLIVCDSDLKITEINRRATSLIGIDDPAYIFECFDPTAVFKAAESGKSTGVEKLKLEKTNKYVNINIVPLVKEKSLLLVLTDVTEKANYDDELSKMKRDTLVVTETVIEKQMRVAQEIASLLGETTAETKIALLNLKKAILEEK